MGEESQMSCTAKKGIEQKRPPEPSPEGKGELAW